MNKSVVMIMGGALVVAIIVALIVQSNLAPKDEKAAVAAVEILVAAKSLQTGAKLKPEDVRWQAWPENGIYKGVIKKSDQPDEKKLEVYEAPLRRNIELGEPITKQALIPDIKGGNNFLAATIDPGMRAVAISVKANTTAGGFVAPGDFVDVILSYSPKLPNDSEQFTDTIVQRFASQTVLRNVRVLAVDQSSAEDYEAKVAKTVTLEVTPEGAEALALAGQMGEITLALRRIGDKEDPGATPLTTDSTTSEVIRKVNAIKAKEQTNSNTVRIYSGSNIQNVPVRGSPVDPGKEGE